MKFRSTTKTNPIYRVKRIRNKNHGFYWKCECGEVGGEVGRPYSPSTRKNARDAYWIHRKHHHGGLGR